jgi:hypothetical protein
LIHQCSNIINARHTEIRVALDHRLGSWYAAHLEKRLRDDGEVVLLNDIGVI